MNILAYIVQGVAYGFAAGAQPGPFQTYLISQALRQGWRRTAPMVAAPLLSDGPILVLVLFLLSRVPAWWVQFLEIAGGVFVIYLGAGAWRSWRKGISFSDSVNPVRRGVLQAALVNLLNPAPYLFWSLVTGPILLTGWREAPAKGIAMLVAFYSTMITACFVIIVLFGMTNRLGMRVTRGLQLAAALALAGFGFFHVGRGMWTFWCP
jgi:threonine/homoserine/homoserine lactone efflux protein